MVLAGPQDDSLTRAVKEIEAGGGAIVNVASDIGAHGRRPGLAA
ncbi:hypothetical protein AB0C96_20410 [Streptomyces sp. NPDC048506]